MTLSGRFRAVTGLVAATLLVSWLAGGMASAQTPTLGDVAKKEEERRKKLAAPAKVYTNKDLPKPAATVPAPAAGAPEAPPAVEQKLPPAPTPEEPKNEKDEAWWRKRISDVRQELTRNEMAAEAFQSRINALTTDFVNRDDPYQRAQIAIDRQKALAELERVKAEAVRLKQLIADIEEEGRQAGVPPGWLR